MTGLNFLKSSLSARLVVINSLGLLGFFAGILFLGQTRESLTDAYTQSLEVQAQIIAEALGESAGDETGDIITPTKIDATDETDETEDTEDTVQAGLIMAPRLDAELTEQILRRIIAPTSNRARVYDRNGELVIDSDVLLHSAAVIARDLPPPSFAGERENISETNSPSVDDDGHKGDVLLASINTAMLGEMSASARRTSKGDDIVLVAVPVQHYRAIIGVLLLTSPPGAIDSLVAEERAFLAKVFLVVLGVTLILSLALAGTITNPVRRLATAIQAFQAAGGPLPAPETVPDFSKRQDEIGNLSLVLRDMLSRLMNRLDTIENFAADVAHELKNPLASINSAVQSLATAKDDATRAALMNILQADILRMNRLITDISEASRLDAELGRATAENFDLSDLLKQMVPLIHGEIQLKIKAQVSVNAQKDRIAQIIRNLLDNALSFSAAQDIIVCLDSDQTGVFIHVDDAGPGLPKGVEQKIFDRFYTDRPDGHDLHSGLGLSISQQIARAHGGNVTARNRINSDVKIEGTRFTLFLPHQG